MIEFCCEYLSARCVWLYVLVMLRTRFRLNPHSVVAWMSRKSLVKTITKPEYGFILKRVHVLVLLFLHAFHFFVLLYMGLLEFMPGPLTWEISLVCLMVLDDLWHAFRCSIIADFISIMFGLSKILTVEKKFFWSFYWFYFFSIK